jgi:hypothetical protein
LERLKLIFLRLQTTFFRLVLHSSFVTEKANEIAHRKGKCTFCFCPTLFADKKQKEHFPSLFLPTLKKE